MQEHKVKILFQHDNDPKHTAKVVKEYLKNARFEVLEWASQSPDVNPIENLWDQVKDQLEARKDRPTSLPELFEMVKEEWQKVPLSFIQNLVDSMPRRCQMVVEAKGETTKY
jgi:transposase